MSLSEKELSEMALGTRVIDPADGEIFEKYAPDRWSSLTDRVKWRNYELVDISVELVNPTEGAEKPVETSGDLTDAEILNFTRELLRGDPEAVKVVLEFMRPVIEASKPT